MLVHRQLFHEIDDWLGMWIKKVVRESKDGCSGQMVSDSINLTELLDLT